MGKKNLTFNTTSTGCLVTSSHKLNPDGYFRKRVEWEGVSQLMMYHRYAFLMAGNAIPEGYEVDHKCKNRACCNVEHLQCLPSSAHRSKDNAERYADRLEQAREFWEYQCCTGTALAKKMGVSFGTACRWIREWKHARDTH